MQVFDAIKGKIESVLPNKDKPVYQYPPPPASEGAFMGLKETLKNFDADSKNTTLLVVNGRCFLLPSVQVNETLNTGGTPENPTQVTSLAVAPGTPHDLAAAMKEHCIASLQPVFGSEYNIKWDISGVSPDIFKEMTPVVSKTAGTLRPLGTSGFRELAAKLRTNSTLTRLDIRDNSLNDESSVSLALAVACNDNSKVRLLAFYSYEITPRGKDAIKTVLKNKPGVKVLHLPDSMLKVPTSHYQKLKQTRKAIQPEPKEAWQPDAQVVGCGVCGRAFSLINRRHHCRACGYVICSTCSVVAKDQNKTRTCEACIYDASRTDAQAIQVEKETKELQKTGLIETTAGDEKSGVVLAAQGNVVVPERKHRPPPAKKPASVNATAGASLAAAVQSVPATSTVVYTESVNTPEAPPVDSIPAAPLSPTAGNGASVPEAPPI